MPRTSQLNPFSKTPQPRRSGLPIVAAILLGCATASADPSSSGSTTTQQKAAIGQAEQLSEAFSTVAEQASPAVVSIRVETKRPVGRGFLFGDSPSPATKGGSGFIFRADGAILTNNHVVENADRVDVVMQDGRVLKAKVLGVDPATDLAVLKVAGKDLPCLDFADSDKARVGQWVVAIGSPFGLDYTLTVGVVSALGRGLGANEIEDYLQTDASINPGNSGGPLINLDAQVLGINTIIVGRTNSGVGFAIPSNLARRVAYQLLDSGKVQRAWIGVSFQELTPELAAGFGTAVRGGALVSSVVPGGPAAQAGIKAGDIIQEVDGTEVHEGRDLLREVLEKKVGQKVALQVLREGKRKRLSLTTGRRPTDPQAGEEPTPSSAHGDHVTRGFGLTLRYISPKEAAAAGRGPHGMVMVQYVEPGGVADRAGLQPGDVIVEADRRPVHNPQALNKALEDGKALLRVEREGASRFVALQQPQ